MCRSGQSIFSRPKPIDISAVRRGGYRNLDLDIEDEDEDVEAGRALFEDTRLSEEEEQEEGGRRRGEAGGERDTEHVWAAIG